MDRRKLKQNHLLQLLATFIVVIIIAFISETKFFRIDLTTENRYTLSESTKTNLEDLNNVILVKVYLDGDLPIEFVRFRQSIRELLDEFKAYGGKNFKYEFINLYDEPNQEIRQRMITELYNKGLSVTNIKLRDSEGGKTDKIIFPGAMISYKGLEFPVNLLKNNPTLSYEINLNNSIQTLEYEFSKAIQSLTLTEIPKIAFIEGHGELDSLQTHSIMDELKNFFQVDRGYIKGNIEALLNYRAIVIAQPTTPFSEADKFAIDQYIMRGGKVLFFLDPVMSTPDSLTSGMTIALANPIGIEDLLFKYGVRIDYNLAVDLQCNLVPVNVALMGEQARFRMLPWIYLPLLSGPQNHPVTKGINYVKTEFASILDTLSNSPSDVKKTAILTTSANSNKWNVPLQILMEEITREHNPAFFNIPYQPIALLLEGRFESFYKNYSVPEGVYPSDIEIIPVSEPTTLFVAGDGDMIRNGVSFSEGTFVADPLGYDKYTRQTFGNREFIMNLVNYITDDTGIMLLRSREFKLRLLNQDILKDKRKRAFWVLLNTVAPILILILFGIVFNLYRKRKYARDK